MASPAEHGSRIGRFFRRDIWQPEHLKDRSPRGWLYAVLRVGSITWTVFNETKAASRAAALSFSSLLGLGPLVAVAVLVGGSALFIGYSAQQIDAAQHTREAVEAGEL